MAETATQASTEAPGGSTPGMPQLDPTWWGGQIVWLALIFLVLYLALSKVFLPKLARTIDEREGKIAGDIADARRLKNEAEAQAAAAAAELTEARAKAQRTAADAKAKAAANAAERQSVEEAKLNERLSVAEAEIRAARDQAMGNVSAIAVETAQAIVEKLTGDKVTKTAVKAAAK
jgi:F-type H+-transporting ATPase subunit b